MIYKLKAALAFLVVLEFNCTSRTDTTEAKNYKDAYLVSNHDTNFLKLKGKRIFMHQAGTYEDSSVIPLPSAAEGRVDGKDIPINEGEFYFKGYIILGKNIVQVNLLVDDTTDKILRPLSWNGEYKLIR